MTTVITSHKSPQVQACKRLHRADERSTRRQFLVEGTHLIEEALIAGWPLSSVYFTNDWQAKHRELVSKLDRAKAYEVSASVLKQMATTVEPDGVVAVAENLPSRMSPVERATLGIALETLQSPDNLGSLIRNVAAFHGDGIWLDEGCVDVTNPKVLRSSAGQWFRVGMCSSMRLADLITQCKESRIQVLGAAADGEPVWDFDLTKPTMLVFGNEGAGLSQATRKRLDATLAIPISPAVESLNVSMAAGILLYEANRQRRQKNSI